MADETPKVVTPPVATKSEIKSTPIVAAPPVAATKPGNVLPQSNAEKIKELITDISAKNVGNADRNLTNAVHSLSSALAFVTKANAPK